MGLLNLIFKFLRLTMHHSVNNRTESDISDSSGRKERAASRALRIAALMSQRAMINDQDTPLVPLVLKLWHTRRPAANRSKPQRTGAGRGRAATCEIGLLAGVDSFSGVACFHGCKH